MHKLDLCESNRYTCVYKIDNENYRHLKKRVKIIVVYHINCNPLLKC